MNLTKKKKSILPITLVVLPRTR